MKKISILSAFLCIVLACTSQTTATFNYTGNMQVFTVPPCVNSITVDVMGAQGGKLMAALGGKGGRIQGTLAVMPGDILNIFVGGAGITEINAANGGYNGGGGVYSYATCDSAGTGGGASDIRLNGSALTDIVVVAGGGGGAGGASSTSEYDAGGNGGGLIGQDGVAWSGWPNSGGKGATQSAGGSGGIACCSCPTYVTSGAQAQGGKGSGDCAGGGGGGGGYYGGGGSCFAGAGGGSSWTGIAMTGVTHTQGYRSGDGMVTLTYSPCTGTTGTDTEQSGFISYPNPLAGSLTVTTAISGELSVLNLLGEEMIKTRIAVGSSQLETTILSPGVYFLTLKTEKGISVRKVIKK